MSYKNHMHYYCQGNCGGMSENAGTCQADGCTHAQQPLKECSCDDGNHHQEQDSSEESLE